MNELQVIEKNNERVLLTSQIAESYGTTAKVITDNFRNNKGKYIEGKHFYYLEGNELREFKSKTENFGVAKNVNKLYLWTEKGALLHAKSLGTDKAWEVYDYLVDSYFEKYNKNNTQPNKEDSLILKIVKSNSIEERMIALNNYKDYVRKPLLDTIEQQQPKVEYHDEVLNKELLMNISVIAKDLGTTAKKLNDLLHQKRYYFQTRLYLVSLFGL